MAEVQETLVERVEIVQLIFRLNHYDCQRGCL